MHQLLVRKKGYAYFNELFVKRHQKLLWRSAKRITVFALGLLIAAIIALLSFQIHILK